MIELGSVPPGFIAPAIAAGRHGKVFILTPGGAPGTGAATLYVWRWGDDEPQPVFDVGAYQQGDPDPFNLADDPEREQPVRPRRAQGRQRAGGRRGRQRPDPTCGRTATRVTVARLKPRVVAVPEELPDDRPRGQPAAAGGHHAPQRGRRHVGDGRAGRLLVRRRAARLPGHARDVGRSGGSSPARSARSATPRKPWEQQVQAGTPTGSPRSSTSARAASRSTRSHCRSRAGSHSSSGLPGAEVGGLFRVTRKHHHVRIKELVKDQLILPGGVDVGRDPYVVGPVFGPGALSKID